MLKLLHEEEMASFEYSGMMLYYSKILNLGRISCVLKKNITEYSRILLKLYSKPLEANAATRFYIPPSALYNNTPRNNKIMLCPHRLLDKITIENRYKSLK